MAWCLVKHRDIFTSSFKSTHTGHGPKITDWNCLTCINIMWTLSFKYLPEEEPVVCYVHPHSFLMHISFFGTYLEGKRCVFQTVSSMAWKTDCW